MKPTITIHLPVEAANRLLTERRWNYEAGRWHSPLGVSYWHTEEALTVALQQQPGPSPSEPIALSPGEQVAVVIGGCTVEVHAGQDAAGDYVQLWGRDCNLNGGDPGQYYVEKFTPPHERRGGNGAS